MSEPWSYDTGQSNKENKTTYTKQMPTKAN